MHRHIDDIADFERAPANYDNVVVADTGWATPDQYRLPEAVSPQLNARTDRVRGVRLQVFRSPVFKFDYNLATGTGQIVVAGRHPTLSSNTNLRPLLYRLLLSSSIFGVGFVAAAMLWARYTAQARWFAEYGTGGWVFLAAVLAAAGFGALAHTVALRKRTNTTSRFAASSATAGLGVMGVVLAWSAVGPSAAHAQELLRSGELDIAAVEIDALEHQGNGAANDLRAELTRLSNELADSEHLGAVEQASTLDAALEAYTGPWHDAAEQTQANQIIVTRASKQIEDGVAANAPTKVLQAAEAVADLDHDLAMRGAVLAAIGEATACIEKGNWTCAAEELARAKPERARAPAPFDTTVNILVSGLANDYGKLADDIDPNNC